MEWIKTAGTWAWGLVGALIGVAVFFKVGVDLSGWFWGWFGAGNTAFELLAAAIIGYVVYKIHEGKGG